LVSGGADHRIKLISATGSTAMGIKIAQVMAERLGRTILELGGNNAVIVTEGADLDLATRAVLFGAVGTAFPADHPDATFRIYHIAGAALFVSGFGLFNFIAQLLRFIRKHVPKPTEGKRKWDYYLDLVFVILVFIAVLWYLLSGLFGFLGISTSWVLTIFNLFISQKILLFVGCIAAFLLDLDDM